MITSLARRTGGGVWYGLERGSFGFFDQRWFHSLQRADWGGPFASVHSVQENPGGALLVGGAGLAGKVTGAANLVSLEPVPNADVFTIYDDGHGRIWMGTAENGLFYSENGRLTPFPDEVPAQGCHFGRGGGPDRKDLGGNRRWVAVLRSGFLRPNTLGANQSQAQGAAGGPARGAVDPPASTPASIRYQGCAFTSLHKQDGLASERLLSLAESDDGSLWVGTQDGLSQLSDVKFQTLSATEGLAHEACLAVATSPDGTVWAGTPNGMSSYREGQIKNFRRERRGRVQTNRAGSSGSSGAANGDVYCIGARKNLDQFRSDHAW